MSAMTSSVERVIPSSHDVQIKGAVGVIMFPVRQIKIGQLPKVLKAMGPISSFLTNPALLKDPNLFQMRLLFNVENLEATLDLLAACTAQTRAWVDELDIDDAIALFTKVLEVNLDFFIQHVLPSLLQGMEVLASVYKEKGSKLAGLRRSNSSSPTGTDTGIS